MKARIPHETQESWVAALATGYEPSDLYRLGVAVRRRLIVAELRELGRDLVHARQRQADLRREQRKRKITPLEGQQLLRRLQREFAKEDVLLAQRQRLFRALGRLLAPARPAA